MNAFADINAEQRSSAPNPEFMDRALAEAARGVGLTSPNPAVGAVVVRNGVEIASGFHERAGEPHAEVRALEKAGHAAHGADLYVTLEPCSTTGRTPACTDAILRTGIRRVVVGCLDANPSHAGAGVALLRQRGVEVHVGTREEECRRINEAFFHWITTARPLVVLKMAMTLDGRIATAGGDSKWVTGAEARSEVQMLRKAADAIMVGAETVRRDNPGLTVRAAPDWPRQPRRFVWTRRAAEDFPAELKIRQPGPGGDARFVQPSGRRQWREFLTTLGADEVTMLLVEGGGTLAAELLHSEAVDKLIWFIAPKILGGNGSRPVVGGPDPLCLEESIDIAAVDISRCGRDLKYVGYPVRKRTGGDRPQPEKQN